MSEAKDAFVFALDECLNRLEAIAGEELADTEEDFRKRLAHDLHPNEDARVTDSTNKNGGRFRPPLASMNYGF